MYENRYTATYRVDGDHREMNESTIEKITRTVKTMQQEDIDIEFLGAKQTIDADGDAVEITARYAAPTKGTVGHLSVLAELPACGSPIRQ